MMEFYIIVLFAFINLNKGYRDSTTSDIAKHQTVSKTSWWHRSGGLDYFFYMLLVWIFTSDILLLGTILSMRFVVFNPFHNVFREAKINFFHLGTGPIDSVGNFVGDKVWYFFWLLILIGSIVIRYI